MHRRLFRRRCLCRELSFLLLASVPDVHTVSLVVRSLVLAPATHAERVLVDRSCLTLLSRVHIALWRALLLTDIAYPASGSSRTTPSQHTSLPSPRLPPSLLPVSRSSCWVLFLNNSTDAPC
ncbi:hypothetical protein BV20DRAFT_961473 [Pilatotrama ljubarskyi]|nr:hypothetical protein BV20DRAFT_961473 [Pilatotrama ljubarskyi]